ncbi:MAG: ArsA family ATPase [Pseudobdellovibrio sp.]
MIEILPSTKTLICIGSGGVGKTTTAAAIAVGLASQGKKVLVLTIDPSLRLAQALGVKTDGELHEVNLPEGAKGKLFSCVINHQKTFEWFIQSAAKNADVSQLLKNRLYLQLSGRLSGSQEFTSLISLYRYSTSNEFDLIILDTPPSQHTWAFLKAPEKIAALFNEGVASWFRNSDGEQIGLFKKFLNLGTAQVLKALETLTGSLFMKELSAFFKAIQQWQGPLESYVMNCHRLLTSPETEFILVTALDSSRIVEAQKLSREILKQGYRLTSVIINRIPQWTQASSDAHANKISPRLAELQGYYLSLQQELNRHLTLFKKNVKVYKCYELKQNSEDIAGLKKTFDQLSLLG